MKKVWIIFDGRAIDNTDDASVYEAMSEEDGATREEAIKTRNEDWPDGFVFEYDDDNGTLVNQRFIC